MMPHKVTIELDVNNANEYVELTNINAARKYCQAKYDEANNVLKHAHSEVARAERHHEFFMMAFKMLSDRDAVEAARQIADRAYPP